MFFFVVVEDLATFPPMLIERGVGESDGVALAKSQLIVVG